MTVTVTHNREERRRDGWRREGGATENGDDNGTRRRRARGERGGRPPANNRGWRRWWTEGLEGRGQREWRRAGGLGTRFRESAPRSGACDWPRVAMVAGAAFTGIHCSSCGAGGARERVGVLVVHIVHVRSRSCPHVSRLCKRSLNGVEDRQKTGVSWLRILCRLQG